MIIALLRSPLFFLLRLAVAPSLYFIYTAPPYFRAVHTKSVRTEEIGNTMQAMCKHYYLGGTIVNRTYYCYLIVKMVVYIPGIGFYIYHMSY